MKIKRWLAMVFLGLGMTFVRVAIKLHPDALHFLVENLIDPISKMQEAFNKRRILSR